MKWFVSPEAGLGLDQLVTTSAKILSSHFPHFHSPLVSHPALTPDCSHRLASPTDIHTCSLPHQPSSAHTGQLPVIPCKIIYCAHTAESQPKFFPVATPHLPSEHLLSHLIPCWMTLPRRPCLLILTFFPFLTLSKPFISPTWSLEACFFGFKAGFREPLRFSRRELEIKSNHISISPSILACPILISLPNTIQKCCGHSAVFLTSYVSDILLYNTGRNLKNKRQYEGAAVCSPRVILKGNSSFICVVSSSFLSVNIYRTSIIENKDEQ